MRAFVPITATGYDNEAALSVEFQQRIKSGLPEPNSNWLRARYPTYQKNSRKEGLHRRQSLTSLPIFA